MLELKKTNQVTMKQLKSIYKIIILLYILFINKYSYSGSDFGVYSTYMDSIIYRLQHEDAIIGKKIQFRFPPIERGEEYKLENIKAEKFHDRNNGEILTCVIKNQEPVSVNRNTRIKLKYFAKNIERLTVIASFESENIEIKLDEIKPSKDNLYYCTDLSFSSLFQDTETTDISKTEYKLNQIKIYSKFSKSKELVISDIITYIPVKITAYSEKGIIDEVIKSFPIVYNNQNNFNKEGELTPKVLNLFEKSNVDFLKYRIVKEVPESKGKTPNYNKSEQLGAICNSVRSMLVEYFENTENKKTYLLDEFDKIVLESKTLDQFYEKLDILLYKLNDNHFKLINEIRQPSVKTILPIYVYKIRNSVQVVSVLDTTLINKVNLGDRLISINGKDINDIIKDLDKRTAGSTKHAREMKILQKLLFYVCLLEEKDLHLEFDGIENGKYGLTLTQEQINNNKSLKIPSNIKDKQKRFDYKKIGEYSYLKVGIFNEKFLRPFFYSHVDSIMQSDGLIIDLRNNPGGDLSGLFLFSFFIDSPEIFFTFHNIGGYHETVVINPDPYYNYKKPVVLLIDGRTTCSAEFFMDAMKVANKTISIGTTKTAGSGQNVKYYDLPDTEKFKGGLQYRNSINYSASGKIIDQVGGFRPAILTSFESYLDLAPYNDQLLNMAIDYMQKTVKQSQFEKKRNYKLPIAFILFAIAICVSWLTIAIKFKKLVRINNLTFKYEKS